MGWERRQRGGLYFYTTFRVNGQPRKQYLGTGPAAEEYARQEAERRQQRQNEIEALQAEQARVAGADRALDELRAVANLLARASLLLSGQHEHHGEWRHWKHDSASTRGSRQARSPHTTEQDRDNGFAT
jgi:hypothetical protein